MTRVALFACRICNAVTILPADSEHIVKEDGEVQPLGFCGLVRETHDTDDRDGCIGTVAFVGVWMIGGIL